MKLDKKTESWFLNELHEGISYGDSKTKANMIKILKAYLESQDSSSKKAVKTSIKNPSKCYYCDQIHSTEEDLANCLARNGPKNGW